MDVDNDDDNDDDDDYCSRKYSAPFTWSVCYILTSTCVWLYEVIQCQLHF